VIVMTYGTVAWFFAGVLAYQLAKMAVRRWLRRGRRP
jgi:hypothetical protein